MRLVCDVPFGGSEQKDAEKDLHGHRKSCVEEELRAACCRLATQQTEEKKTGRAHGVFNVVADDVNPTAVHQCGQAHQQT